MTHYHFIGIGGTGLSAIARVLLEKGNTVSGSDYNLSPQAQELKKPGGQGFNQPRSIKCDWGGYHYSLISCER